MARADLLVSLANAAVTGDRERLRRIIEALIAEERAKQHHVLADDLARSLEMTNGPQRLGEQAHTLVYELTPERKLAELVLPPIVEDACRQLVDEQHRRDLLRSYNLEPRNRLLVVGPPGNGKTSLAEALAGELLAPMFVVRYEGVIASYLGETASRLQRLFDTTANAARDEPSAQVSAPARA